MGKLHSLPSDTATRGNEKGVLKNFAKFTGKHLCQSNEILAQVFFCEFCDIFKNTYFTEHPCWLLLYS